MMSASLYAQLPSKPRVYSFENAAPDIVGVGGASAAVKGYIDVPLRIADVEVAHPLLVVENLSFSLLIGMDILDPHAANISTRRSSRSSVQSPRMRCVPRTAYPREARIHHRARSRMYSRADVNRRKFRSNRTSRASEERT